MYNGNPGYTCGTVTFTDCKVGIAAAYFDGTSFLINTTNTSHISTGNQLTLNQLPNADDFLLGAGYQGSWTQWSNNSFTIDCWVKPELGAGRYYPICSSCALNYENNAFKLGWVLQIDASTGHLQMIGYLAGDWLGNVVESQFQIPFDGDWTHITVSGWPVIGSPSPAAQAMYKNGIPDHSYANMNGVCRFLNSATTTTYAPFFIGLGPRSQFTNPGEAWGYDANPYYGYHFKGAIDNFRICLDQRWPAIQTNGNIALDPFWPPGISTTAPPTTAPPTTAPTTGPPPMTPPAPPTTAPPTTSLTTTAPPTTSLTTTAPPTTSLTTTAPTTTLPTPYIPMFIQDLLILSFDSETLRDSTNRHTISNRGAVYSSQKNDSYEFSSDKGSFVTVYNLRSDWYFGCTPCPGYHNYHGSSARRGLTDNNFCVDCWVYPVPGGGRYYPIFSVIDQKEAWPGCGFIYYSGCALQIDTATGHLQILEYAYGLHANPLDINFIPNLMVSNFSIPMNQWSHIAVQSWKITPPAQIRSMSESPPISMGTLVPGLMNVLSRKNMYLNGVPDVLGGTTPNIYIAGVQNCERLPGRPELVALCADLEIGHSVVFDLPGIDDIIPNQEWEPLPGQFHFFFNGYMKNFRISEGPRFNTDGSPFTSLISTTTTSTFPPTTSPPTTVPPTTSPPTTVPPSTWTTGTTITYTMTSSWITTISTYIPITPIPPYTRVSVGGVADACDYIIGYGPEKAFNLDINSSWMCNPYNHPPPYWVSYSWLNASYAVDEYKIYLTSKGRPKDWEFQGSNDGVNWVTLDTQTGVESEGQLINIVVNNVTAYNSYRLYITAVWSALYAVNVSDIQLYINSRANNPESSMHWLGYNFEQEILVQRYCMMVPEAGGFTEWKLQGSNDGIFWSDVDYQKTTDWIGWKCIDIEANELSFFRWRLLIMNWSRLHQPQLIEFEIFRRP